MNREEYLVIFRPQKLDNLRCATYDLSWLLSRDYTMTSSLKLVGDRYRLHRVGRAAVKRATVPDRARSERAAREVTGLEQLRDAVVWIDGFNILITAERALRGDPILRCRDGVIRDIAGVHGTYRRGRHTNAALEQINAALQDLGVSEVRWLFDQPVSNSGRAAELARRYGEAEVVADPDQDLIHASEEVIVISGDGEVIERSSRWFNLLAHLISGGYLSRDCVIKSVQDDAQDDAQDHLADNLTSESLINSNEAVELPWLIDLSGQG